MLLGRMSHSLDDLESSENSHGGSASSLFFAETLVIDRVLSEGVRSVMSIYPREFIIDYVKKQYVPLAFRARCISCVLRKEKVKYIDVHRCLYTSNFFCIYWR